jgi:hypothetical protein
LVKYQCGPATVIGSKSKKYHWGFYLWEGLEER